MIYVLLSIVLVYVLTISWLIFGLTKINSFDYLGLPPKNCFTIIVPFRNEVINLPLLLDSLSKLNYPAELFEVLLIDDDSSDGFTIRSLYKTPSKINIRIIQNIRVSNSPKKDAIQTAIQFVNTEWIITTDADCIVDKNWLLSLNNYIELHTVSMIAGAVTYDCDNSFLQHFQQLDLASLQGATIGSFGIKKGFMCNGANLAYTKSLFRELNGFDGNDSIASGDDVFLLQKAITQFPKKVHYLKTKNNIVLTKPLDNWKSLFYQRVRWASKTTSYQSDFGKRLGLVVFFGNLVIVLSLCLFLIGLLSFQNLGLLFLLKFIVDSILINKTSFFLNQRKMSYLILSSLLYPFFSVSVALYSFFGEYEWKGRRFTR
jgi:cellulose synthase/poly-beta-1,6-N-acetylglucosamine synthase-like glycosyltransferase